MDDTVRTLSERNITRLRNLMAKDGVAKTYRAAHVNESTLRRALAGKALTEANWSALTRAAEGRRQPWDK